MLLYDIKGTVPSVLALIKKHNNKTLRHESIQNPLQRRSGYVYIISTCNTLNIAVARNE